MGAKKYWGTIFSLDAFFGKFVCKENILIEIPYELPKNNYIVFSSRYVKIDYIIMISKFYDSTLKLKLNSQWTDGENYVFIIFIVVGN